jgi:hypothetical protein
MLECQKYAVCAVRVVWNAEWPRRFVRPSGILDIADCGKGIEASLTRDQILYILEGPPRTSKAMWTLYSKAESKHALVEQIGVEIAPCTRSCKPVLDLSNR